MTGNRLKFVLFGRVEQVDDGSMSFRRKRRAKIPLLHDPLVRTPLTNKATLRFFAVIIFRPSEHGRLRKLPPMGFFDDPDDQSYSASSTIPPFLISSELLQSDLTHPLLPSSLDTRHSTLVTLSSLLVTRHSPL